MADHIRHPTEALHDAVDGRLNASEQSALDAHLSSCERCRREIEMLRLLKQRLAAAGSFDELPAALDRRLRRALDDEDRRMTMAQRSGWWRRPRPRWIAAAAVLVAVIWIGSQFSSPGIPDQVAADFRAFSSGTLPLAVESADASQLEGHLQRSLPFTARVFDFGAMDYQLAGGGVHRVANFASALFAYRSPDGRVIVCQMYPARTATLPRPTERRTLEGIEFLIYHQADVTVVFWQDGPVVCVLAANADREAAIRLALAKAVES